MLIKKILSAEPTLKPGDEEINQVFCAVCDLERLIVNTFGLGFISQSLQRSTTSLKKQLRNL